MAQRPWAREPIPCDAIALYAYFLLGRTHAPRRHQYPAAPLAIRHPPPAYTRSPDCRSQPICYLPRRARRTERPTPDQASYLPTEPPNCVLTRRPMLCQPNFQSG